VTPVITQQDVEDRIGPERLAQLLDDDGDGVADAPLVGRLLQQATDRGAGRLLKAFSADQIAKLAAADAGLRDAFVDLFLMFAGQHRPEFVDANGRSVFAEIGRGGLATLGDYAAARDRILAEETKGTNQLLGFRVTRARPPIFTFAATKGNPRGPGGF
jgi:hypothetical protein